MCDTLCIVRPEGTFFAKNSDRHPDEVQLVESHRERAAVGTLRTTHIEIADGGAFALMGARPEWGWGMEHGVNEHGVAIGNEKVWTVLDPRTAPAGLTGMDLVRLGLERARSADEALDVMTTLLAEHGQGGVCDKLTGDSYFSSFIIADVRGGWVLETSGRSWVAAPVQGSAAISNRLTLSREWTRSSPDIATGTDWEATFRHPRAPTGHADVRLAASRACLASEPSTPAELVAHLRDHGHGPWGSPSSGDAGTSPLPTTFSPEGAGVTVCMHLRKYQNTTSSIVAELPRGRGRPVRAWVTAGQPCASVYVPVFPPDGVPGVLGDAGVWHRFEDLRNRIEAGEIELGDVRRLFAPAEAELWEEADQVAGEATARGEFAERSGRAVMEALAAVRLG